MRLLIFILVLLSLSNCKTTSREREIEAKFFLSNISMPPYDSIRYIIGINDNIVVDDSIENEYISGQWEIYKVKIPAKKFRLNVEVIGKNFRVSKDTLVDYADSLRVFSRFDFIPLKNVYNDPKINTYIKSDTITNLNKLVDSLYKLKLLTPEYIKDSIPSSQNIEIFIK